MAGWVLEAAVSKLVGAAIGITPQRAVEVSGEWTLQRRSVVVDWLRAEQEDRPDGIVSRIV